MPQKTRGEEMTFYQSFAVLNFTLMLVNALMAVQFERRRFAVFACFHAAFSAFALYLAG
jgi:hypothetical protein